MEEEEKSTASIIYSIIRFIGGLFAIILSWSANHSVLWAILHYIFGWLYVIYYFYVHNNLDPLKNFLHSFF